MPYDIECPKCGGYSANPDVCESCGALISVIRKRYEDAQRGTGGEVAGSAAAPSVEYSTDENGSITRKLVTVLVVGIAAAALWVTLNRNPGLHGDGFVYSVFEDNFDSEVLNYSATPVLVDFHAKWCGPCKQMAPHLEEFAGENLSNVKIVKVDIERDFKLAQRFGVQVVPTLVLIDKGREVYRAVGAQTASELSAMVARHK
jgi:thioredoxin